MYLCKCRDFVDTYAGLFIITYYGLVVDTYTSRTFIATYLGLVFVRHSGILQGTLLLNIQGFSDLLMLFIIAYVEFINANNHMHIILYHIIKYVGFFIILIKILYR